MSNEQKLREAFEKWAREQFYSGLACPSDTWSEDQKTYNDPAHHMAFCAFKAISKALATTEPEPTGMPELPEPDSYEFQHEETGNTMFVDRQQVEWGFEKNNPRLQKIAGAYTTSQMRAYGEQCWKAGYKHGAWGDKPAVNQQLTTEPVDEREAFEREMSKPPFEFCMDRWPDDGAYAWPGNYAAYHTQCAWVAWQARAAMAQGVKG